MNASGSWRLEVIEFSPDGDRILSSREQDTDSSARSLWSVSADGSEPRRLVARVDWADWRAVEGGMG